MQRLTPVNFKSTQLEKENMSPILKVTAQKNQQEQVPTSQLFPSNLQIIE